MKTIFLTMTALSALAISAPAAAQSRHQQNWQSTEFQAQIDAGVHSGAITTREARPLRISLRQLMTLERQFSANGISGREHATLQRRGATLRQQISSAERFGNGRYGRDRTGWNDSGPRNPNVFSDASNRADRFGAGSRFDTPNRGDRFSGDVRIGQRAGSRMIAMPEQYRDEFRDNDDVYYRYDDRRIYQIDRKTDLVLGLLDV